METIIEILTEIQPDLDCNREDLIDGHLLDSLAILSLVAELEDAFDVMIPAVEIIPDNFNSVKQMKAMIDRLVEEE
mgnify:FL=1